MIFIYALIAFNVCHFFGDFVLVDDSMLSAKKLGSPIGPILTHSGVHAFLMAGVCLFFNPITISFIYPLQFSTHFLIDLLKGKLNCWFPSLSSPANKRHWILFGFDQLLHQLVIILQTIIICYHEI